MAHANYSVVGIRPDGTLGVRKDCESLETARFMATIIRRKHPDWKTRIDCPDDTATDLPVMT